MGGFLVRLVVNTGEKACCRNFKRTLHHYVPGICPVRDTTRFWDEEGHRATRWEYLLREHSFMGLYYSPQNRPHDLSHGHLVAIFLMKSMSLMGLCLVVREKFRADSKDYYARTIVFLILFNSTAWACFKSAIKRTLYCLMCVRGMTLTNASCPWNGRYVFVGKLGRSEDWSSLSVLHGKSNFVWPEDELELSIMGDELHFNLLQVTNEMRYRKRRRRQTQQIGNAVCSVFNYCNLHPVEEIQQLELAVTDRRQGAPPKSKYDLGRFVPRLKSQQPKLPEQPMQVGNLRCEVYMRPDEPLTFVDVWWAFWRPITECILFKLCCWPCILGINCFCKCVLCFFPARQAPDRRRSGPPSASADLLLPGSPKRREPQLGECPGVVWRMLLWTLPTLLVLRLWYDAARSFAHEDKEGRGVMKEALWMFLQAKSATLLLYEPASLYVTHACVMHLCPSALPKVRDKHGHDGDSDDD